MEGVAMKKVLLLTFVLILFLLSACQSTPTQSKSWEKNGVQAKVVEPLEENKYVSISWGDPSEIILKDEIDALVVGTITNTKEIEVQYTDNGDEIKYYRTIFDFKVNDAIYPNSLKEKNIKISSEITSRTRLNEIEGDAFTVGKKYLLALKSDIKSPLKILGLADYYMFNPVSFMLPTDASEGQIKQIFDYFTSDKNKNSVVENAKDSAKSSFNDFKDFLREYFK